MCIRDRSVCECVCVYLSVRGKKGIYISYTCVVTKLYGDNEPLNTFWYYSIKTGMLRSWVSFFYSFYPRSLTWVLYAQTYILYLLQDLTAVQLRSPPSHIFSVVALFTSSLYLSYSSTNFHVICYRSSWLLTSTTWSLAKLNL